MLTVSSLNQARIEASARRTKWTSPLRTSPSPKSHWIPHLHRRLALAASQSAHSWTVLERHVAHQLGHHWSQSLHASLRPACTCSSVCPPFRAQFTSLRPQLRRSGSFFFCFDLLLPTVQDSEARQCCARKCIQQSIPRLLSDARLDSQEEGQVHSSLTQQLARPQGSSSTTSHSRSAIPISDGAHVWGINRPRARRSLFDVAEEALVA